MKKIITLFAFSLLFISCTDDNIIEEPILEPIVYTSGTANFSKFVSVGNSLTAGYSDGALFEEGQKNSLPVMLAGNFRLAGGGDFKVPLMADNLGGLTLGGVPLAGFGNRLVLSFRNAVGGARPSPTPVAGVGKTEVSTRVAGPFNNMGIPGAKSFHFVAPGYGNVAALPNANPFFIRMASSANATVLADAISQSPTFFSLWIGNNDVLGYATQGGAGADHNQTGNLNPATYGPNDITNNNTFASIFNSILQAMTAKGAGGIVANIPNVTTIPYFRTVPHNPIPLDAATAGFLNSAAAYGAYNAGLAQLNGFGLLSNDELAKRRITFAAGPANAVVIIDEDLTNLTGFNPALINMRQATASDLIVLPAQSIIGTLANPSVPTSINGVAVPLADRWVLTPQEQASVATAIAGYNQTIAALAAQYNVALVDVNAYLNRVATSGVSLPDGSRATATYATGGAFSLDGVHPSPRGYALIANEFTKVINTKYGSNLPNVNPLDFKGLYIK